MPISRGARRAVVASPIHVSQSRHCLHRRCLFAAVTTKCQQEEELEEEGGQSADIRHHGRLLHEAWGGRALAFAGEGASSPRTTGFSFALDDLSTLILASSV
jgi:hypothetical protein